MKPLQFSIPTLLLLAGAGFAQAPTAGAGDDIGFNLSISVKNIVAPVVVTDRSGNLIDGLQPNQFHLFDNGKEQNIQVDVAFQPISVVLAIEAADRVEAILPQIKHLGTLMPLIVGDHGEAAVMAFDSRMRVMQDFTSDPDKVKAAIDKINAGNSSSRMIDTIERAVYMLSKRPADNRKIVLLVSETRDKASEGRVREALIAAQLSNVVVYTVDITQFAVRLSEKPTPPRPDSIDVTARPGVLGNPSTPTSAGIGFGTQNDVQFAPLLQEIYRDTKRIFVDSPSEVFAKGTGGGEFSFIKQRGLEDAVQRISQEIRSQYLITYRPTNVDEPGFHAIAVNMDKPGYITKTRPGYYIGGGKAQ